MYRIMGIDTSGKLKLIKATRVVNGSSTGFRWDEDSVTYISWNNSELYQKLNGEYFLSNSRYSYMQQATWTNLIDAPTYYIGKSTTSFLDEITYPQIFIDERSEQINNGAKIGLMYASDLVISDVEDNLDMSWLALHNGLNRRANTGPGASSLSNFEWEWTSTTGDRWCSGLCRWTAYNFAYWPTYSSFSLSTELRDGAYSVRPVFYIDSSKIKLSGKGIIGDPYYITNVN